MYTNYFLTVWFTYSSICSLGHQLFRSCVQSFVSLFKCATSTPLSQTRFPGRTTWRWWNWPGIYLLPRKIPESTSLSFLSAWIQHGHPRAPIAPCRAGVAPRKVRKPTDAHWLSACQFIPCLLIRSFSDCHHSMLSLFMIKIEYSLRCDWIFWSKAM